MSFRQLESITEFLPKAGFSFDGYRKSIGTAIKKLFNNSPLAFYSESRSIIQLAWKPIRFSYLFVWNLVGLGNELTGNGAYLVELSQLGFDPKKRESTTSKTGIFIHSLVYFKFQVQFPSKILEKEIDFSSVPRKYELIPSLTAISLK